MQFACEEAIDPSVGVGWPTSVSCVVCAEPFEYMRIGRGRKRRTCSAACRKIRTARRLDISSCAGCDRDFRPGSGRGKRGRSRFCSRRCWLSRLNPQRRKYPTRAEAKAAHDRRRRARLANVEYEEFSDREIFERDNWRCGICHWKVDQDRKFPDWYSASLDHIVPLSRGGGHTRRNVQCSHWICNSRKTFSLAGVQLRLFG